MLFENSPLLLSLKSQLVFKCYRDSKVLQCVVLCFHSFSFMKRLRNCFVKVNILMNSQCEFSFLLSFTHECPIVNFYSAFFLVFLFEKYVFLKKSYKSRNCTVFFRRKVFFFPKHCKVFFPLLSFTPRHLKLLFE